MKIVTLTLNPALDKSAKVDNLTPENKLHCHSITYKPGGGGINVSRILKRLGIESSCIFPSGGETGSFLEELILNEDINLKTIPVSEKTRENLSVLDTQTGLQYRFGIPGAELLTKELIAIQTTVDHIIDDNYILVLSGSLPQNAPSDFYAQIIQSVSKYNVKIILDTSGEALKKTIDENLYLLKPNQNELAKLAGKDFLTSAEQEAFVTELIQTKNIKYIVVSMGARGAFLASKKGIHYQSTPSVMVKSTIGAGDSMLAGLIYGIQNELHEKKMLRWGVACGTATTMSDGTALASLKNIEIINGMMHK
ncbi:1-phosphofructokinase family hexose kinase [Aquimarina latercula]|uniref:1-phosphofructokinase family hexose kinase n=1 Tax=Aquimarina latercula TaxID=987 RepID=UPI000485F5CB|nr:1-phosphofructokinase family hexose kinase [Aquimarina latercula]